MFIRNFLSEFFSGPLPKSMLLIGLSGLKIWVYVTSCKNAELGFFYKSYPNKVQNRAYAR